VLKSTVRASGFGWCFMNARNKRRWSDLCGEAEVQEDTRKLKKLAEQIVRILDAEQKRLQRPPGRVNGRTRKSAA
jgi:hypothetical protein